MFELSSKFIEKDKGNTLIKKNISLENNLDCFIHIESKSKNFTDALLNSIVDNILDKISQTNTYGDFSIALENINAFIKAWNTDKSDKEIASVVIGILQENNFIFSNIGKASAYLISRTQELITLTDTKENKNDFSYISNGELKNNEFIILSTQNILEYLSPSDILDGFDNKQDLHHFSDNIASVLDAEILGEDIVYSTFKYKNLSALNEEISENKYLKFIQDKYYLFLDTVFMKKLIVSCGKIKGSLFSQSKTVKSVGLIVGISISIFFLNSTLTNIVGVATNDKQKALIITQLEKANILIRQASNNVANNNIFEESISKAESIITQVNGQKLYLEDLDKMQKNIQILKRQFNKIETFTANSENEIYTENFSNFVKILKKNNKIFIVENKGITGPINLGIKPKVYTNTQLDSDEKFVDATIIGDNIYLNTNKSKIVRFAKTGFFSFVDVLGQKKWEPNKNIISYRRNIYLTDPNSAQIFKHSLSGNKFTKATPYLKPDDVTAIGKILSITIDGGFYILKNNLTVQKFFASPKYEMQGIVLNKLPKNYKKEDNSSKIEIKTNAKLNYVYMLLNNKIFVFQPNSRNYKNVISLTYIGQIEGNGNKIKDFYINNDGDLWVINNKGVYNLKFEISDNKLIIR